jgi:hypothetical protein
MCFLGSWVILGILVEELSGQPKFSPYSPILEALTLFLPFDWPLCDIHLSHSTFKNVVEYVFIPWFGSQNTRK